MPPRRTVAPTDPKSCGPLRWADGTRGCKASESPTDSGPCPPPRMTTTHPPPATALRASRCVRTRWAAAAPSAAQRRRRHRHRRRARLLTQFRGAGASTSRLRRPGPTKAAPGLPSGGRPAIAVRGPRRRRMRRVTCGTLRARIRTRLNCGRRRSATASRQTAARRSPGSGSPAQQSACAGAYVSTRAESRSVRRDGVEARRSLPQCACC